LTPMLLLLSSSVIEWSEFLAAKSYVPGSIPGALRFSEWQWAWNGVHSALVRVNEELLPRQVAAPDYTTKVNDRGGSTALTTRHPFIHKSWHEISPTSGGRSVGILRLRTKGHRVLFSIPLLTLLTKTSTDNAIVLLHQQRLMEISSEECKI
jgi:hypothetical protein